MFSRVSSAVLLFLVFFAAFAAATTTVTVTVPAPGPTSTPLPASQCSTSGLKCCDALERSDGSLVGLILGLLGVVLQGVEALVGINCVPINILGIGQNSCAAQAVCCEGQNFSGGLLGLGLISIGCVPININL